MRLRTVFSFDTNNYFHTTVSLGGVVTFLFFRFVPLHSWTSESFVSCEESHDLKI